MDARNNDFDFDFMPIGQAIKKARIVKGMTRDELSRIVDYDPRHLQTIENEGCWHLNCDDRHSVRPDPYSKKTLKTYIQEFLEQHNGTEDVIKYELEEITLNVLNIERTFVDKLMSVKRHAICGSIEKKVRHIYDVVRLFSLPRVKEFVEDKAELKRLIAITKQTDSYYLEKRNISQEYDPNGAYDFESRSCYLNEQVRSVYENLHKELLYTDEQQNFDDALATFSEISNVLKGVGE